MRRTTVTKYLLLIMLCAAVVTSIAWPRFNFFKLKFPIQAPDISTLTISKTEKQTADGTLIDTNGSWKLTWTASSGATTYRLEESAGGGAFSDIYLGSARSKTIKGKGINAEYYYRIRACNRSRCSAASAAKSLYLDQVSPSRL